MGRASSMRHLSGLRDDDDDRDRRRSSSIGPRSEHRSSRDKGRRRSRSRSRSKRGSGGGPPLTDPNKRVSIDRKTIENLKVSKNSPMPTGLFDRMTKDEIMDLIAYLISGGDARHEYFKK